MAWEEFRSANGYDEKYQFLSFFTDMQKHPGGQPWKTSDTIGCILLSSITMLPKKVYPSDINLDLPHNIVSGKTVEKRDIEKILNHSNCKG